MVPMDQRYHIYQSDPAAGIPLAGREIWSRETPPEEGQGKQAAAVEEVGGIARRRSRVGGRLWR
jgi:hypothetical protein